MKRTLLFVTLFSFVAVSAFVVTRNIKTRNILVNKRMERESGEKDGDKGGFADAEAYLNKLRANQVTGTIDLNDYYTARAQADYNLKHPATRGGGLNLQWQEMGPDNVGGRTRAILYDKQKPGWVFAGAVSGGLWYSTANGSSWNKIPGFDSIFKFLTVSALAQGEDGSIYFGTGESFTSLTGTDPVSGAGGFPGDGIWKSTDHGSTWSHIAIVNEGNGIVNNAAYSYINHLTSGGPAHPGYMYAAINGDGTRNGIVYWNDTTSKWVTVQGLTSTAPGYDVEVGSNGVVHAIVGTRYYRSTDGVHFKLGNIPSPGSIGANRVELSVSTADPNYVYAISSYPAVAFTYGEIQGVYKSEDGGQNWSIIAPEGTPGSEDWEPVTQGGYALTIAAWPGDKNVVFIGGIDCYKGVPNADTSLGYNWTKVSNWNEDPSLSNYIHADIHRFVFDPTNPDNMFIGSDGGLSYTKDAQATYPTFGTRNLQYNVTQFYSCTAKPYTGEPLAGAQDNGNIYIDFNGNTVQSGKLVKGGDGGDVAVSYINPLAMFAEYTFGAVQRSSNNGQTFNNFFDFNIDCIPKNGAGNCSGDGMPDEGAAFIAPILLWENITTNDSNEFFIGTNTSIWMTRQALNFAVTPEWFRLGNPNNGTFISLAVSSDGSTVYGGTDRGALYRISGLNSAKIKYVKGVFSPDSAGVVTKLIWTFPNQDVTGISVDVNNPDHVVCSLGNYSNQNYVYECFNATDTSSINPPLFSSIQGSLPTMPVYSIIIDHKPGNSGNIIAGTELGVYSTSGGGTSKPTWIENNAGLSRVPIFKLRSVPVGSNDNVIYASAYGRGVFRTYTLDFTGVNNVQPTAVKGVNVYPNPASNQVFVTMQLPLTGSSVELTIFDITGRRIKTINEGKMGSGPQLIEIPTNDLNNGTYLLNIRADNEQTNAKFIILK